jgi:hypothetical protein
MNLLKKINSILSESHKEAVRKVFEQIKKRTPDLTPREAEFEAKRLIRSVGNKTTSVMDGHLAQPGERISSEAHNYNMEQAYIDLHALYKEAAQLNGIQESHKTTIDSDYNKARAAVLKLINDARVYAIRSANPEYDDIKAIDFNIESNRTTITPAAQVSDDTRLLKLAEIGRNSKQLVRRGLKTTTVEAEIVSDGEHGQIGRQFPAEYAVDSKNESFWAELIYKDVPTTFQYTLQSPDQDGQSVVTVNGPVVKYNLTFSNAEIVNQVKILPFSNFPVRVLEITYRSNPGSPVRRTVPGFTQDESLDWMEFNFESIFAVDIEIVFVQESYRNFQIKIPKSVLFATDFLLQLIETRGDDFASSVPVLEDLEAGGNAAIYDSAIEDLKALTDSKELDKLPTTEVDLAGKTILSIGEAMAAFSPDLQGLVEEVSTYTEELPKAIREDIATINKVEYLVGAREIQCNYAMYSPVGHYASEKLDPKATVSNVRFESDEYHPEFDTSYGPVRKTAIEWSLEFADDRSIPVYPANHQKDGLYPVKDEFLKVDNDTRTGLTRFPSKFSFATVRENGNLLMAGQDYSLVWDDEFDGKLQIAITGSTYDSRKLYTVDYFVKDEEVEIDVLSKFNDRKVATPDLFEATGPDNEAVLSYYPFIKYDIINSDDFISSTETNAYTYIAPTGAYTTGHAIFTPNWTNSSGAIIAQITGSTVVSGIATGNEDTMPILWDGLDQTYLTDPYRWYIKIKDLPGAIYEVLSIDGNSGLSLVDTPSIYTGVVGNEISVDYFTGNVTGSEYEPLTGVLTLPYSLEVVYKAGEEVYGFDNVLYKPINVFVGGVEATNVTDYVNLEQPAFTISDKEDGEYEYIHDGKNIYFNQSISNTEILIDYRWMTQYVRVNGVLRANKAINPTVTPQVDEYRLFMNTTIL